MKNKINIKNILIITSVFAIMILCIGFIFLSNKLHVKTNEKSILKVEFTKIQAETPIKGGIASPTETKKIINDGLTAKFNFILNAPQDELSYKITIKNTGTLPAKIINILSEPDYINDTSLQKNIFPIVITQSPITKNKLMPNEEVTIKLVVSYGLSAESGQKNIPYQLTILATTT